jgi:cobalt-zinc-cadmium efflux system outer membrane protein
MAVAEDFLDVFFLPARKKIAQSQFHQSQSRVTHEVLLLAGQTREAFYRFQSAQKVVELRKTAAEAAADASAASKALHDAGNITDLEWFSQQTQEARTKAEWVAAQAEADDARERVNELMGISGPRLSWTAGSDLPPLPPKDPLLTDLETLAVDQRMDLAAAREQVATQGQVLGLTRQTSLLGGLELGAQAERETDGQWRIGPDLNVNVPIFDQGQAAVARAFAEFGQSRRRYEALEADVRSQVRRAAQRVRNARVRADDYEKQVLPLQRKLVRQMQLEYNSMLTGVFALLQARRDEIDAGREYIESLRDYWIARVELEQAVGGRLKVVNLVATQPAQSQP